MSVVLGVNAFHADASACLLRDGALVAAAEEERFRRIKHWAGLPLGAVRYCLAEAGIQLKDVNYIAVNQDSTANLWQKLRYTLSSKPDLALILARVKHKRERASVAQQISNALHSDVVPPSVQVEHHLAHVASAFYPSSFDASVVLSVDGFGDFASAAWGTGGPNGINLDDRIYFPHSLGIFYQAMTQYLGFPHYGDEYKVMGLAPYGRSTFIDEMREIIQSKPDGTFNLNLSFFRHHQEKVEYEWDDGEPLVGTLYSSKLVEVLGRPRRHSEPVSQRHMDIANSVQRRYEEVFLNLLNALYDRYEVPALALAGGCAMNSVANGKIKVYTPFKQVYIQSAAGDAGGAIGAAMYAWHQILGNAHSDHSGTKPRFRMVHAYWGPSFTQKYIDSLLGNESENLRRANCEVTFLRNDDALCRTTAEAIAQGKVVGWFQGRMEWGPRALGNRSILGDPRRADMKDILNLKIKRRESFRPFAPSILRESVPEWFEVDDDVPFMMQVYPIRPERRPLIPAVTHVDGTGRLQTVSREANALYYRLIETFRDITGVPMLLNTSFNENEPVVCSPEEGLDCFLRTRMDVLVLGSAYIERHGEG